ncbi:MXAN_5187 family protein [Anaeromyxobacter paludicola]|uniref:HAMP domain-containing protein n=1 Tax=Anaeromyxobacter paludicola TaxID=2918171 RepID=A0ABN6NBL0_9BACT|nr:MXAN_5187 family protein [Anaeromyxobacter paludicola]BDG10629.1 hypothetical protein AMPC_37420 [Anaeromyxobacter paludicola]
MNRLKIWVLTLLAVGAGLAGLFFLTGNAVERAQAEQDARLSAAAAHLDARVQLLSRQATEVAEAAARADAVKAAPPDGAGFGLAAQAALEAALKGAGLDASRALAGYAQGQTARVDAAGKPLDPKDPPAQRAVEAAAGTAQKGFVRTADGVWYAVALPAGPGAALVVGLPLDAAFAKAFRAESGAELLVSADVKRTVSSLPAAESPQLFALPRTAGAAPTGVGRLAPAQVAGVPAPLLLASAPAWRARVEKLGASGAAVVLAVPTAPALSGLVPFQYAALVALALLLLVGLVLGATAHDGPRMPRDLLAAAEKVGQGDYTARAPIVSGPLGTVAQAMNRASQAALAMQAISREEPPSQLAPAPPPAPARPGAAEEPAPQPPAASVLPPEPAPAAAPFAPESPEPGLFAEPGSHAAAAPPPPEPPPAPAAVPYEPAPAPYRPAAFEPPPPYEPPAPPPYEASAPSAPWSAPVEPAPEAVPLPPPRADTITGATNLTTPTRELMLQGMAAAAEQSAPPPAPTGEEAAWRDVFSHFLDARTRSGEGTAGLTWEKFQAKLQKNKEQLQQKYGCRDVRFSVYLKEGRAALKATPVK